MKIKEAIYQTPEMSEEKLLELINKYIPMMKNKTITDRIIYLHKNVDLSQAFLDEYDLIQDKKSKLTKSQRDQVVGFIGMCMIEMTRGDNGGDIESK